MTDKFGLAWTDGFDIADGSSYYSYKAYGVDENGVVDENNNHMLSGHHEARLGTGVGWNVNLISGFNHGWLLK
ncbi:hypothetical protein [Marinicrinis lubricantis]|uniref:Uncharacterized protein n=1 Tax=Marinicrinis lubricantis TaxID=2086470 RepID=A0ABW1IW36_9BACL